MYPLPCSCCRLKTTDSKLVKPFPSLPSQIRLFKIFFFSQFLTRVAISCGPRVKKRFDMFPDYYYAVSPRYFYFLSGRPHVPRVKKGPLSAPRFLLYVPTIFRRMPGIEPELKIGFL